MYTIIRIYVSQAAGRLTISADFELSSWGYENLRPARGYCYVLSFPPYFFCFLNDYLPGMVKNCNRLFSFRVEIELKLVVDLYSSASAAYGGVISMKFPYPDQQAL